MNRKALKEIEILDFYAGVADDPRKMTIGAFMISKHFDIFSAPNRLIPYRSLEADTHDGSSSTGMKQYVVKDFVYASASAKLYGLGQTGGGLTKIVYKADATTGNWTLPANSEGNAAVQNGCLVEYKDYLWGFQGTVQVFRWGLLSGTPSITDTQGTVGTITSVAQGVVGKDDNLYLPYNNKLVRVNSGGTVTDAALTLPTNLKITSLTRYGNYLAIGCAPISTFNGTSVVYLWNYTSPDVQEPIDWGDGELRILETIEGYLVGVTDRYLNNDTGAGRGSMVIQMYSGGVPQVIKEVFTQKINGKTMPLSKAIKNNRLFFSAKIMTNTAGTEYDEGIWSFGRKNANSPFALTLDIIDENVTTAGIQAFGTAANYFFITHSSDGSIDKTNDAATYAFSSIYESLIFDFGEPAKQKQLRGVSVTSASIPSGGTVTLKYKKDSDTNWTTIGSFANTGLSPVYARDFINIESTAAEFSAGKEYKFRVESTGGAEITSIKIKAIILNAPN
jgi:hypothetical protein